MSTVGMSGYGYGYSSYSYKAKTTSTSARKSTGSTGSTKSSSTARAGSTSSSRSTGSTRSLMDCINDGIKNRSNSAESQNFMSGASTPMEGRGLETVAAGFIDGLIDYFTQ